MPIRPDLSVVKSSFKICSISHNVRAGATTGSGSNLPTSVEIGNGTQVVSTARVFTQGVVKQTGEQMDIALDGDGFIEVQMPDGTTAYTRDGALKIASDGTILTSNGYTVLSKLSGIPSRRRKYFHFCGWECLGPSRGATANFSDQPQLRFNNPGALRSAGANLFT